ncbi:MAG: HAD-IC family P-type ATPase, partial [Bdellovibrionota bacterium]
IERLWKSTSISIDKTGTLTSGKMSVSNFTDYGTIKDPSRFALALELNETHPIGKAIVKKFWNGNPSNIQPAWDVQKHDDGSITGVVDGNIYALKPRNYETCVNEVRTGVFNGVFDLLAIEDRESRSGLMLASIEIEDRLKPEAKDFIAWIRKNKFSIRLISGDRHHTVQRCGLELGLTNEEIFSEATPETKSAALKATPNSVMIGDGANDAAALASAEVGIAVRGSMETSLRAADVYLTGDRLDSIQELFEISRRAKFAITRNLAFSVSFNIFAGSVAVMGFMTPLWAAVLMPLSSLTVLLSSLLANRPSVTSENPR